MTSGKPGMRRRALLAPQLLSPTCTVDRCRRLVTVTTTSTLLTLLASWHHATAVAAVAIVTESLSSPADIPLKRERDSKRRQRRYQQQRRYQYYSHSRQLHQQQEHPHPKHVRQMKQGDDDTISSSATINSKSLCKETASGFLYPGDTLSRGEFLCRGDLRFGIDATHGYFMVGFVNWAELAMIASSSNSTTTSSTTTSADVVDGEEEEDDGTDNERMDDPPALWDIITPTSQAWRANPTTLFTPLTQSFSYLNLTEYGNILGYDDEGNEIYDSNYDDINQLGSKRGNSRLSISSNCWDVNNINVEDGEMCVKLTSPPRAGMPYGTDTWGIRVYPEKIVPVEPLIPPSMAPSTMTSSSASPTSTTTTSNSSPPPSLPPVSVAAVGLDAVQTPSLIPTYSSSNSDLSNSPSPFGTSGLAWSPSSSSSTSTAIIDAPTFRPSHNYLESDGTAHIYGKVWRDSNRDGEINVGETTINNFGVTLFECSEDGDDKDGKEAGNNKGSSNMEVTRLSTDSEGMFFHEVPDGKTYQVHFESNPDEYGFSSGVDTGTDKTGWSECKSTKDGNVQWNAGLYYLNDTSYEEDSAKASIGGHIYLDVNENGHMEPEERAAAVGGYTVNNAKMVVSITNCMTYEVIETLDKRFPGTYSFGNLTEGSYKLRYEIQALTRVNTPNAVSLYSIIDKNGNNSSVYEMPCGKLGYGVNMDSGNVGVRMAISPYAAAAPVDPLAFADAGASQKSAADANASTLSSEGEDAKSGGGNNSFVPALVGSMVTLSIVALSAAIFVRHRHGDLPSVPFFGSGKNESVAIRSVGSNDVGARSLNSGASNTQNDAIGTLIVDAGSMKGDDGIELGIRQLGLTQNSTIGKLPEEASVGFEVYDDEDDGLQESIDYGPVISDMIAKFSQQKGRDEEQRTRGDERDSGSMRKVQNLHKGGHEDQYEVMTSPARSKKKSPQRQNRGDTRDSNDSEMNQTEAQHHNLQSQSQLLHASQKYVAASNVDKSIVPGNTQSYMNELHDNSQYQYDTSVYIAQGNESVTIGSSRSTDPPAASYRDIPAHVGWNRDIQLAGDIRQYETPTQYVAGNGVPVATYTPTSNDESSHQMMNHDTYIEYPPVDSGNSIPNSKVAGRHASSTGWSGFSSAVNSIAVTCISSPYKRSYKATGSSRARSRRAQSNPRDGQLSERWRQKDVAPANSTVEYNAYSTASVMSVDDDKTALSMSSDQSSDPPGASYMNLAHVPPLVPPQRMTPPIKFSPTTSPNPRQDILSYPSPSPRTCPSPPLPLR